MSVSNPLRGMPLDLKADYEKQPARLRAAYIAWWVVREDRQAAHRDTWPAFLAGWLARSAAAPHGRPRPRA